MLRKNRWTPPKAPIEVYGHTLNLSLIPVTPDPRWFGALAFGTHGYIAQDMGLGLAQGRGGRASTSCASTMRRPTGKMKRCEDTAKSPKTVNDYDTAMRVRTSRQLLGRCLLFLSLGLAAQGVRAEPISARKADALCSSGVYRCGKGVGDSPQAAQEAARHALVTSIRVLTISSESSERTETGDSLTSKYRTSSKMLAVMQLDGLQYRQLSRSDGRYRYLAFVEEEALQASMVRQRQRVRSMVNEALQAAAQARIDDALRLTYWAYLLAHTVDTLAVEWPGLDLADPRLALLEGLGQLVGRVRFATEPATRGEESLGIALRATYEGRPATLDLSLYTGAGMDYPHLANGRGYIELHWDPEALTAQRQQLSLQLLYAYEGKMRHFPEMEALHQVFGNETLDTYVNVEVVFPFVAEAPKPRAVAQLPPQTQPAERIDIPLPIRVLAEQTEPTVLLEALQAYARNNRLQYYKRRPAADVGPVYVALATEERVLGMYRVDEDGYFDVRRQQQYDSLERPEFEGAYRIWVVVPSP